MTTSREMAEQAIALLQNALEESESQRQNLEQRLAAPRPCASELEQRFTELQGQFEEMRAERDLWKKTSNQLQDVVSNERSKAQRLTKKLKVVESGSDRTSRKEINFWREQAEEYEAARQRFQQRIHELKAELSLRDEQREISATQEIRGEEFARLESLLAERDARIAELGATLQTTQLQIDEQARRGNEFDTEVRKLSQQVIDAEAARNEACRAADRIDAELKDMRAQAATHRQTIEAMQQAADQQKHLTDEYRRRVEELETQHDREIAALREEHGKEIGELREQALQRLRGEHDTALEALRAEHEETQASLREEYDAALATLRAELEDARASQGADRDDALAALRAEHEEILAAARAQHEAALSAAGTEHEDSLAAARAEHEDALASLQTQFDAALAAHAELEQQFEAQNAAHARELEHLGAERAARDQLHQSALAQAQAAANEAVRSEFESQLATLREELETRSQQHSEAQVALESLQGESAQQIEAVRTEYSQQLSELESELAEERHRSDNLNELANERREALMKTTEKLEEMQERYEDAKWHLGKASHFEKLVRRRRKLIANLIKTIRARQKANNTLKAGLDSLRRYKANADERQQELLRRVEMLENSLSEAREKLTLANQANQARRGSDAAPSRDEPRQPAEAKVSAADTGVLRNQVQAQAEVIENLEADLKSARLAEHEARTKLRDIEKLHDDLETKNTFIGSLQKDMEEQQKALAKLRKRDIEVRDLRTQAEDLERRINALQQENAQLRSAKNGEVDAIDRQKIEEHEATIRKLTAKLREYEGTITTLSEAADSWKRKYDFLAAETPYAYESANSSK